MHWHAAGNASAAATATASGVARNDGCYGADSGPSRDDPRRPAIRPVEAFKAAVCYVRNTSIPAVPTREEQPYFTRQASASGCGIGLSLIHI